MSNADAPLPPRPPIPPGNGNGCLSIFLVFIGVVLLIPGILCALITGPSNVVSSGSAGGLNFGERPWALLVLTLITIGGATFFFLFSRHRPP